MLNNSLLAWDYVVAAVFLALFTAIGLYYAFTGGRQRTVEEYVLGNRQISYIPIGFSLTVTIFSSVQMLGQTSEHHLYGTQIILITVGHVLAVLVQLYVLMPVFCMLHQVSVCEYFGERFGQWAHLVAAAVDVVYMLLYMGVVLYAPATALATVMDIDQHLIVAVIGIVCTFYSTIGGMKAVVATDTLQALTMLATFLAITIRGANDVGGLSQVFRIAKDNGRLEFFNMNFDPTAKTTFWTQTVGGFFFYLTIAVSQNSYQRYLSTPSLLHAQKGVTLAFFLGILVSLCTMFSGLTMYATYAARSCDPYGSGQVCHADQMLPFFVMELYEGMPGLTGLFLAGILSSALSTISSSINSLAAITWADFINPYIDTSKTPEWKLALANKALAALYGLSSVGLATLAHASSDILKTSMTIYGVVGGPFVGFFVLGMLVPFSSQKSALTAFIVALALSSFLGFGYSKPYKKVLPLSTTPCESSWRENSTCNAREEKADSEYFYLFRLSYMWMSGIGAMTTIIVGVVLSFIWPQPGPVDPHLLSPALNRIQKYAKKPPVISIHKAETEHDVDPNEKETKHAYERYLEKYKKKNSFYYEQQQEIRRRNSMFEQSTRSSRASIFFGLGTRRKNTATPEKLELEANTKKNSIYHSPEANMKKYSVFLEPEAKLQKNLNSPEAGKRNGSIFPTPQNSLSADQLEVEANTKTNSMYLSPPSSVSPSPQPLKNTAIKNLMNSPETGAKKGSTSIFLTPESARKKNSILVSAETRKNSPEMNSKRHSVFFRDEDEHTD